MQQLIRKGRLDQLIESWNPKVRAAFLRSVDAMRSSVHMDQLVRMVKKGDVDGAMRAVGLDPAQFRPFDQAVSGGFEAAGNFTAISIPTTVDVEGFRTVFQFNVRNPEAEKWLSDWSSTKITQILDDQRVLVKEALTRGLVAGRNPQSTALDLVGRIIEGKRQGGLLGLTSSQAEWTDNYRDELKTDPAKALSRQLRDRRFDRTVQKAIDSDQVIPSDLVDNMVTSYANRALKLRGDSIARTETMAALHEAQQQSVEQAVKSGVLDGSAVGFIWRTAEDTRVRESHAEMDGQTIKMGEMFVSGLGNELEYPGDSRAPAEDVVNCRCWREPNVDFFASVVKAESSLPIPADISEDGTSKEFRDNIKKYIRALPPGIAKTISDAGVSVKAGERITGLFPELKGVTPRGWPKGSTWDEAEGLYYSGKGGKEIAITQKRMGFNNNLVDSPRVKGVFHHETGHGYDDALGRPSHSEEFVRAHTADVEETTGRILDPKTSSTLRHIAYYIQNGSDAGRQEAFAELFAIHTGGVGADATNIEPYFPRTSKLMKRIISQS